MNSFSFINSTANASTIEIRSAEKEKHFKGILELQELNAPVNLSEMEIDKEGFVTVKHSPVLLEKMAVLAPQIIALMKGEIVGYVLSMHMNLRNELPVLKPMFDLFEKIDFKGRSLTSYAIIIGGQTCIAKACRGSGLLKKLYDRMKQELHTDYDLCVTEIAVSNIRSMKAHERVGFETIHTYCDDTQLWSIVVWDWNNK